MKPQRMLELIRTVYKGLPIVKTMEEAVEAGWGRPNEKAGLCYCGCGEPAPLAIRNSKRDGTVKGCPRHYIHNHHLHTHQRREELYSSDWYRPNTHGGYCHCRCGLEAPIAKYTNEFIGTIMGERMACIPGHYDPDYNYVYRPASKAHINGEGYRMVFMPEHIMTKSHYVVEHRFVMSEVLKRVLTADEKVHHINRVRTDNRPENLQLVSVSEHASIHQRETRSREGLLKTFLSLMVSGRLSFG